MIGFFSNRIRRSRVDSLTFATVGARTLVALLALIASTSRASSFGAVAHDDHGHYAVVVSRSSEVGAASDAIDECQRKTSAGNRCHVTEKFIDACLAVIRHDGAFSYMRRKHRDDLESGVQEFCSSGQHWDCDIQVMGCDDVASIAQEQERLQATLSLAQLSNEKRIWEIERRELNTKIERLTDELQQIKNRDLWQISRSAALNTWALVRNSALDTSLRAKNAILDVATSARQYVHDLPTSTLVASLIAAFSLVVAAAALSFAARRAPSRDQLSASVKRQRSALSRLRRRWISMLHDWETRAGALATVSPPLPTEPVQAVADAPPDTPTVANLPVVVPPPPEPVVIDTPAAMRAMALAHAYLRECEPSLEPGADNRPHRTTLALAARQLDIAQNADPNARFEDSDGAVWRLPQLRCRVLLKEAMTHAADNIGKACALTETACAHDPDSAYAHFLAGYVNYEHKNRDAAIEHLTRSAELEPDDIETLKLLDRAQNMSVTEIATYKTQHAGLKVANAGVKVYNTGVGIYNVGVFFWNIFAYTWRFITFPVRVMDRIFGFIFR